MPPAIGGIKGGAIITYIATMAYLSSKFVAGKMHYQRNTESRDAND